MRGDWVATKAKAVRDWKVSTLSLIRKCLASASQQNRKTVAKHKPSALSGRLSVALLAKQSQYANEGEYGTNIATMSDYDTTCRRGMRLACDLSATSLRFHSEECYPHISQEIAIVACEIADRTLVLAQQAQPSQDGSRTVAFAMPYAQMLRNSRTIATVGRGLRLCCDCSATINLRKAYCTILMRATCDLDCEHCC